MLIFTRVCCMTARGVPFRTLPLLYKVSTALYYKLAKTDEPVRAVGKICVLC